MILPEQEQPIIGQAPNTADEIFDYFTKLAEENTEPLQDHWFDVRIKPLIERMRDPAYEQAVMIGVRDSVRQYYLSSDQSGHNYIVPVTRKKEFEAWSNLDEDDEDAWEAPDYAFKIEGQTLHFENPTVDGKPLFYL